MGRRKMGINKKKKFMPGLQAVIIAPILIILVAFALLIQITTYFLFYRSLQKEFVEVMQQNCADIIEREFSSSIVDEFDNFLAYDKEEYQEMDDLGDALSNGEITMDEYNEKMDETSFMVYSHFGSINTSLGWEADQFTIDSIKVLKVEEDNSLTYVFSVKPGAETEYLVGDKYEEAENDSKLKLTIEEVLLDGKFRTYNVKGKNDMTEDYVMGIAPLYDSQNSIAGLLIIECESAWFAIIALSFIALIGVVELAVLVVMIIIVFIHAKHRIIKPIKAITDEAGRFATENTRLSEKEFPESNIKEINGLIESVDHMERDVMNHIDEIVAVTRENERIGTELALAADIQRSLLPGADEYIDNAPEFDIYAQMTPAREVGGDFYDYFMLDDDHLVLIIADVSDKGVGAAFFMSLSKILVKARTKSKGSAGDIIAYADEIISENNDAGMFITMWLGIVDLRTGHVNSCNAGHDYPAIMKAGEGFAIEKTPHGPPIAFLPGSTFVENDFDLLPGDRIFLYTDGVNEALGKDKERFGTGRMLDVLNANKDSSNEELLTKMKEEIDSFTEGFEQFDDMTMLGFTFKCKKQL